MGRPSSPSSKTLTDTRSNSFSAKREPLRPNWAPTCFVMRAGVSVVRYSDELFHCQRLSTCLRVDVQRFEILGRQYATERIAQRFASLRERERDRCRE